jgi:hypothetical protein
MQLSPSCWPQASPVKQRKSFQNTRSFKYPNSKEERIHISEGGRVGKKKGYKCPRETPKLIRQSACSCCAGLSQNSSLFSRSERMLSGGFGLYFPAGWLPSAWGAEFCSGSRKLSPYAQLDWRPSGWLCFSLDVCHLDLVVHVGTT